MTAPPMMTPEERERLTHEADRCPDTDSLAKFLAGPVKGAAAVEATTLEGSYDAKNIQRRRWGVGTDIRSNNNNNNNGDGSASAAAGAGAAGAAPPTPPAAATPSWWQKTSWFAGAVPDVGPVLADPTGADGGTPSAGGLPTMGGATCQNRFVGPGQRDPHDPQTAKSVRLNPSTNSPCEDPGEIYGGYNAVARSTGGGAYTPVGGAMVHSRLSIQPRKNVYAVKGPRCADDFEAATRPAPGSDEAAAAESRASCAFASAAARPKYGFDFERGVWEVQGTGAAVRCEPRVEAAPLQDDDDDEDEEDGDEGDAMDTESDGDGVVSEEMSPEELALMETTRDLRLNRFGAVHEAALAALAERKAAAAAAQEAKLETARAAARANKRAAASVPLTPTRRPAPQRDGDYTYQHTATADASASSLPPSPSEAEAADALSEEWQMLRLTSGDVVFFGAPDASPQRVAAWISGEETWPEVRVMELSRRERCQLSIPRGAPGPLAADALAEAAREELRTIAAEDAEAAANAANASIDENGGGEGGAGKNGHVRLPPGSTATPQQANIIEQLVNATGANKEALEAAEAAGSDGDGGAAAAAAKSKEKEMGVLQDKLREVIREKHDAVVAARAAEARVAALEAALAAAGVAVPPC